MISDDGSEREKHSEQVEVHICGYTKVHFDGRPLIQRSIKNLTIASKGIQNHTLEIHDNKIGTFLRAKFSGKLFTTRIFTATHFET